MPWKRPYGGNDSPSGTERAVSALCYITGGIAGIIYIIISKSSYQSSFFRFHFLQSIILMIIAWLLGYAMGGMSVVAAPASQMFADLLSKVASPELTGQIVTGTGFVFDTIFKAWGLLPIYGLIWAALGKIAEIPFISDVVRNQMR